MGGAAPGGARGLVFEQLGPGRGGYHGIFGAAGVFAIVEVRHLKKCCQVAAANIELATDTDVQCMEHGVTESIQLVGWHDGCTLGCAEGCTEGWLVGSAVG